VLDQCHPHVPQTPCAQHWASWGASIGCAIWLRLGSSDRCMGHPPARTRGAFALRMVRTSNLVHSGCKRGGARAWEAQHGRAAGQARELRCVEDAATEGAIRLRCVTLDSRPPRRTCSTRDTFAETRLPRHQCIDARNDTSQAPCRSRPARDTSPDIMQLYVPLSSRPACSKD
jgi:hypothetical protein